MIVDCRNVHLQDMVVSCLSDWYLQMTQPIKKKIFLYLTLQNLKLINKKRQ